MKRILVLLFFCIPSHLLLARSYSLEASKTESAFPAISFICNNTIPFLNEPFDSTLVTPFFSKYPKLKYLKPEVVKLYRKHNYQFLWYDRNGMNEFADLLYSKINNLDQEGLKIRVPYKEKMQSIFQDYDNRKESNLEVELLMSSLYFFYFNRVYKGVDIEKTQQLGWYLPRKKQSYVNRLDSLLQDPSLINKKDKDLLGQYYQLKEALQKYRNIEKKGGWSTIVWPKKMKSLKPGDTADVVLQIRNRLYLTRDLSADSKKNWYDNELVVGVLHYKERNAFIPDPVLLPKHIKDMNIPVNERIKTIMTNMERCRWISPSLIKTQQYIMVNIPSFNLTYFKNGKPALESKVVVGKSLNRTVVFSGEMSEIVFSPYWNVPSSILRKEILPAIAKNANYLAKHNMEWVGDKVRQRPGPENSLGLVKFVFPNSFSIYMHDTPAKNLFKEEQRAFSHGCVRVARARDLAVAILKDDKNWTVEKIDAAMNRGAEKTYKLKTKIPVYIGYFTAWVDRNGTIHFYNDIYGHDDRLTELLLSD
ncbi:murein L,D-transpeptidase [Flavobacterium sp. ZS1P70]|uniref:Murein L,D-transpeptidase n=1 Tax=Flavobacterium zhoui TaxID=3230414 RepID=A0ABW6I625_9FLAO